MSSTLHFYIGKKDILEEAEKAEDKLKVARRRFEEILQVSNLHFLVGSGCSAEVDIPLMKDFAVDLNSKMAGHAKLKELVELFLQSENELKGTDLEPFLGFLYVLKASMQGRASKRAMSVDGVSLTFTEIDAVILLVKNLIYEGCRNLNLSKLKNYKLFVKKLLARDPSQSLPRTKIFSTNYDLAFEHTFDLLGVHYFNGFSGTVNRKFNPSVFESDLHYRKLKDQSVVERHDKVIDLVKLHGSINWKRSDIGIDGNIYGISEITAMEALPDQSNEVMIYPTPSKVGDSMQMPYSAMFRIFHQTVVRRETTLIVVGYGFSDEHVNEVITQALTIPSFRLIIVGKRSLKLNGVPISDIDDPRIWQICDDAGADDDRIDRFGEFVDSILPSLEEERVFEVVEETLKKITTSRREDGDE